MTTKFEKGLIEIAKYVTDEELQQMTHQDALADIAPELRKFIIEFAYGEIYSRGVLADRERQLIVIASVVTQGVLPQIKTHIKRGLTIGLSQKEVVEAIMQMIPYVGFPRVQNALMIAKEIFEEEIEKE